MAIEWHERNVYLYSTPETYIADYHVTSLLDTIDYKDGLFSMNVQVKGADVSAVSYNLLDAKGQAVLSGNLVAPYVLKEQALTGIKPWSAEHPNLYTLVLQLKDKAGKVIETTGSRVGFRTSEIKNGRFCINGTPVLVKGANRHEHSQLGRTVSKERCWKTSS